MSVETKKNWLKFFSYSSMMLFPFPFSFITAFIIVSCYEIAAHSYQAFYNDTFVHESPPGYLICFGIVCVLQFIFGLIPQLILKKMKASKMYYLLTGVITAALVIYKMDFRGNREWHFFILTLAFLTIVSYWFSYLIQNYQWKDHSQNKHGD